MTDTFTEAVRRVSQRMAPTRRERVIRLLSGVYPSSWRYRYMDAVEAEQRRLERDA